MTDIIVIGKKSPSERATPYLIYCGQDGAAAEQAVQKTAGRFPFVYKVNPQPFARMQTPEPTPEIKAQLEAEIERENKAQRRANLAAEYTRVLAEEALRQKAAEKKAQEDEAAQKAIEATT